ncbi:type VI secretion system lipoprotein TssJ [Variovorax guangxiensis]|uniref:type VI secretion system lipoprotein TssJ n=1 Tax=Variovorax guangxiensis TaxID=1775474 RepID=UPI0028574C45|nr:type VI secretion system lipoprotein TssJ [Variovorax guangxiensis]MDR6856101.1 type VI secretion system VasD/TssJ family lipoprotein [Variovorax guangxiensis]
MRLLEVQAFGEVSRRRLLPFLGLMPVLWSGLCQAQPQAKVEATRQRRIALVIGNGRYPEIPLNNPEHDARLVAQTLRSLGFEVGEYLNLTARDFKRVLREFARRMDDDQVASVFYYAGHGVQIGGRNYLLPVDIALRDEAEVRDEAIDLQEALLAHVDRVRPRARIFIIDACRNDPFAARGRSRNANGLAEMAAPGALIAFSAAPGGVAEDGPIGGNSIYTRHLATELRSMGVEVEEMMKAVRVKVLRDTAQRQIPWVNTSMVVNFMFNPGAAPALAGPKRNLQLLVQAQRSLNTDARNASASLALRVYVLRDASGFEKASFDSLYDDDEATLGSNVLVRESLHLRPGEARELALELSGDARALAVFGAFREIERSQWRAILPLPVGTLARVRVDAQARQLQLGWAK